MLLRQRAALATLSRSAFMLYVCRVPALAALTILLTGACAEQIHEVVRVHLLDLVATRTEFAAFGSVLAIYVGLLLLGWILLFWSRYALSQRVPRLLANNVALRSAFFGIPLCLASLPWIGGALALAGAAEGLSSDAKRLAFTLQWLLLLLGTGPVLASCVKRWRASRQPRETAMAIHPYQLGISIGIGLVLLGMAACAPLLTGKWLGTLGALLAFWIFIVPCMTWLTASPSLPRWHWLSLLACTAALWSALDWNDNHELRTLPEPLGTKVPSYGEAFHHWLKTRTQPGRAEPYPVVFVAAEGGGIRAAYFTAQVLSAIQDRCPAFAKHLFVISGVSGGSVGAAVFAGLVDASDAADGSSKLPCSTVLPGNARFTAQSDAILKANYLAPLAFSLLFPDALQRILPFAVPAWDRARTLEESIENSFSEEIQTDFMRRSIYTYWRPERNVPVLILNATQVETGHRAVASPVYPLEERFHRLFTFYDARHTADFRISTMAVTSARFPFVTPAASLKNGTRKSRFVDGGYFENSGAMTLAEAVDVAMQTAAQSGLSIRPVVIRIGNSPSMLAATEGRPASAEIRAPAATGMGELMSPIRSMINTREARGVLAAEMLKTAITTFQDNGVLSDYVEFQIGVDAVPIPLGWQLASTTRQALVSQLRPPGDCTSRSGYVNGCSIADVVAIIRGASPD